MRNQNTMFMFFFRLFVNILFFSLSSFDVVCGFKYILFAQKNHTENTNTGIIYLKVKQARKRQAHTQIVGAGREGEKARKCCVKMIVQFGFTKESQYKCLQIL